MMIDIGPRPADITLSWKNLYAYNRKIIDPIANRYFFVDRPKVLAIKNIEETVTISLRLHPDDPKRGSRLLTVKSSDGEARLLISSEDFRRLKPGSLIRLIELFNVKILSKSDDEAIAELHSKGYEEAKRLNLPLIHWLPEDETIPCEVIMPDGSVIRGLAEKNLLKASVDQIVQFERFGFVRIDQIGEDLRAFFAHE